MAKINYRLGLDLGATSLGWCVYRLNEEGDPCSIVRAGVRIFSDGRDPQSLASRAADRRAKRQARRRRDRLLKRRQRMLAGLVRFGLLPQNPTDRKALLGLDPFELRARGLDEELPQAHLGRTPIDPATGHRSRTDRAVAGCAACRSSPTSETSPLDQQGCAGLALWEASAPSQSCSRSIASICSR